MKSNSLQKKFPEIAAEWHPTKNGDLTPSDVAEASSKKVWWMCEKGHEWEATIHNRSRKSSKCPVCTNKKILVGYNDLATMHPDIAKYWHPTKNGDLTPKDVFSGSDKKVWWQCENGHEWKVEINKQKKRTFKCLVCASSKNISLIPPEILAEWDVTRNGEVKTVPVDTGVWWKCSEGHLYKESMRNRGNGKGCPACTNGNPHKLVIGHNDLATTRPELAKEWNYEKNAPLLPSEITAGSRKKMWWKCQKCSYEWETFVYKRKAGVSNCPVCNNTKYIRGWNDLETKFPELAKEWHPTKNGKHRFSDFCASDMFKVWWHCENGHEWKMSIHDRVVQNKECPFCKESCESMEKQKMLEDSKKLVVGDSDLSTMYPEIAAEWHPTKNGYLTPSDVHAYSHQKAYWLCENGHWWCKTIASRTKKRTTCPVCRRMGLRNAIL